MKCAKLTTLIWLLSISTQIWVGQIQAQSNTSQTVFTIDRVCDGGACHFQMISFNYSRKFSISVGIGDPTLFYYFSVDITDGKISKEYIYSDEPNEHFVEKESGQQIDATLNKLLLDVYKLGNYIFENDLDTRNKKFSETGRFAVLANLRNYITKSNITDSLSAKKKLAEKSWQAFWKQFSIAVKNKDKAALKRLMVPEKDFWDGGGGQTRDEWLQSLDKNKLWGLVQASVAKGTKSTDYEDAIERLTNDVHLVFRFVNGKWRFVGIMGD